MFFQNVFHSITAELVFGLKKEMEIISHKHERKVVTLQNM